MMLDTDVVVLDGLAREGSYWDRVKVAGSVNASAVTLRFLAQDQSRDVRMALAANQGTPPDTLKGLLFDSRENICVMAAANPVLCAEDLREIASTISDPFILFGVARNPNTPVDVLGMLPEGYDDVWERLFYLGDEDFTALLRAVGFGDLVGLPLAWVWKTLVAC